jgi:hypothetical protein
MDVAKNKRSHPGFLVSCRFIVMRVGTFVASFLSSAALTLSVVGMFIFRSDQPFLHSDSLVAKASSVQEVVATAAFPDTNSFSRAFVLYSILITGEPNVNCSIEYCF